MPQTSAVTLLPPKPVQSSTNSSYSQPSENSFRDTLDSATQAKSSKADAPTAAQSKHSEKTAKKPAKQSKARPRVIPSKSTTVEADSDKHVDEPVQAQEVANTEEAPKPTQKHDDSTPAETEKPEKSAAVAAPNVTVIASNQLPTPVQAQVQVQVQANAPQAPLLKQKAAPAIVKSIGTENSAPIAKEAATANAQASQKAPETQTKAPESVKFDKSAQPDAAAPKTAVKPVGFCNDEPDSAANPQQAKAQGATAKPHTASADASSAQQATNALPAATDDSQSPAHTITSGDITTIAPTFEQHLQNILAPLAAPKPEAPVPTTPESQFIDANHPAIVTGVQTQLLPDGGTMQLHLNPPEMGALQVTVQMHAGVMSAAFETSNDQATRMLSHSLGQLKTALESTGVSVEKMHVQQAPKQQSSSNNSDQQQQQSDPEQRQNARQEQQRRQMLQRMWNKLAGVEDPLDLVA